LNKLAYELSFYLFPDNTFYSISLDIIKKFDNVSLQNPRTFIAKSDGLPLGIRERAIF